MKCVLNVFKLHNYLYLILFALLLLPTNRTSCSSSRVRAAFDAQCDVLPPLFDACSFACCLAGVKPMRCRCAAASLLVLLLVLASGLVCRSLVHGTISCCVSFEG